MSLSNSNPSTLPSANQNGGVVARFDLVDDDNNTIGNGGANSPSSNRGKRKRDEHDNGYTDADKSYRLSSESMAATAGVPKLVIADEMEDFIEADEDMVNAYGASEESDFEAPEESDEDEDDDDDDELDEDVVSDNDRPPTPQKKKKRTAAASVNTDNKISKKKVLTDSDHEEQMSEDDDYADGNSDNDEDGESSDSDKEEGDDTSGISPDALLSGMGVGGAVDATANKSKKSAPGKVICDVDDTNVLPSRRRQRRAVTRYVDPSYSKLIFADVPQEEVAAVFDDEDSWFDQKFVDTGVENPSEDEDDEEDDDGENNEEDDDERVVANNNVDEVNDGSSAIRQETVSDIQHDLDGEAAALLQLNTMKEQLVPVSEAELGIVAIMMDSSAPVLSDAVNQDHVFGSGASAAAVDPDAMDTSA